MTLFVATKLPLKYQTPADWAKQALEKPLELLNDHAYLERKATSNALELINRWPHTNCIKNWTLQLSSIARDEASHFYLIVQALVARGGNLTGAHKNPYAYALRKLVRQGVSEHELVDRLLVSALIEARSCERFEILAHFCKDETLAEIYRSFLASEANHYKVFLRLAHDVKPAKEIEQRWEKMLEAEAQIIIAQPLGSRIHSSYQPMFGKE